MRSETVNAEALGLRRPAHTLNRSISVVFPVRGAPSSKILTVGMRGAVLDMATRKQALCVKTAVTL